MRSREDAVREFILAFGQDAFKPMDADRTRLIELRRKLLTEEYREVMEAMDDCMTDIMVNGSATEASRAHLLKEMADLQYVLSGMAVAFGLPLEEAFERVHESNMSKLGPDGKPIYREDGKALKGPNYQPPVLDDLIH